MINRVMNSKYIGRLGSASKIITFKENEFKRELAPANAIIEDVFINNEKCIRMTYTYD